MLRTTPNTNIRPQTRYCIRVALNQKTSNTLLVKEKRMSPAIILSRI